MSGTNYLGSVTNFDNPEALQCKLRSARYGSGLFKKGTTGRRYLATHHNPDSNFDHRDQHAFIPRIPVGSNISCIARLLIRWLLRAYRLTKSKLLYAFICVSAVVGFVLGCIIGIRYASSVNYVRREETQTN